MNLIKSTAAGAILLSLPGCVAKTAFDVVTAPVKIAGKAADMATTSQSEADEKRGRDLRNREERLGKLERKWRKLDRECENGRRDSCIGRDTIGREIDALMPTIPARERD